MGVLLMIGVKNSLSNRKRLNHLHDNACGWGLNGNRVDSLIDYANKHLSASDFENCYLVDYILKASDYNDELIAALASHPEYFGNHIDEVTLVIKDIPLMSVMVMGANKDSVKISYNNVDYVKFKDEEFIKKIMDDRTKKLTIYGRPLLNVWQGKTTVQCVISDYELKDDDSKYEF